MAVGSNFTGATIAFGTSTVAPKLLDIDWSGIERASIDVRNSTSDTDSDITHIPGGLNDWGSVTCTYDLDTQEDITIVAGAAVETITITLTASDALSDVWTFPSAFVTAISPMSGSLEERMTGSLTFKVAKIPTVAAGV